MSDPTETPRRGRPKTLDRLAVVETAMNAYWEDGPNAVSLNAICQRAGVSKPSLYREFGNDDGLARAALEHYGAKVLGAVLSTLGGEMPFADKIRAVAKLATGDDVHAHGCLFVKMRAGKRQMGPQTQALIEAMEQVALEAYADALNAAHSTGEWSGAIPVDLAARYLQEQIGLALDQRARGEDPAETLDLALSVVLGTDR